jgi:tryptophan synthase alpha chain
MNRIDARFAALKKASRMLLAPFVTVGYPTRDVARELALGYVEAGADMLEVGVPFSDPIADGPTVQAASQVALDGGTCLAHAFDLIADIRIKTDIPVLLMGYANPFMHHGFLELAGDLASSGADGLITPDILPEQAGDLEAATAEQGLHLIRFAAPTTPVERLSQIAEGSEGFVYCVSVAGVTGSRATLDASLPDFLERVRSVTSTPRVVGFGISKAQHIRSLQGHAEGVIVASALIDIVRSSPVKTAVTAATTHVRELVDAT